jgi:hypothetical protein
LKINSTAFLLFLSASFPAYGGKFQQQIYSTAEESCTNMGVPRTNREYWTTCMEGLIEVHYDGVMSHMGYSKPPAKTPTEIAEERCIPKYFELYNVPNKEECLRVVTPTLEDRHRKIWNETSELD